MKTKVFTFITILSLTALFYSCSHTGNKTNADVAPAITLTTQHLGDTSSFVKANGDRCTIVADATIEYPATIANGTAVDSLQRLFALYVLESGDTLSLKEAMHQVVANSMHQYDFMGEPMPEDVAVEAEETDDMTALNYATSTKVAPIFNRDGIVTFERVDVIKKNGKVSSITHRYYSFDVESQTLVDVNHLFRDDAIADVCQLLKNQLLAQNNAKGNEQLNDLGYFNVENISVTRNFYFDDKGVTWSFLPNELAVEAVGEPKITIPYGDLESCLCDKSIIDRLN